MEFLVRIFVITLTVACAQSPAVEIAGPIAHLGCATYQGYYEDNYLRIEHL